MMNYCEWSKHAQVAAIIVVYVQGVSVAFWNVKEGARPPIGGAILDESLNTQVSNLHVAIAIGSMVVYSLFLAYERNVRILPCSTHTRARARARAHQPGQHTLRADSTHATCLVCLQRRLAGGGGGGYGRRLWQARCSRG